MSTDADVLEQKEQKLKRLLHEQVSLIVAYSGGVDSSLLAYYARKVLGERAKVVIAVSPSLAAEELIAAREQAVAFNWQLQEISTHELDNPNYERNDQMRCYHCKKTLFAELEQIAAQENINSIAYGANVDDQKDYRPGHKAAREFNVISPLQEAGMVKEDIRQLAKAAALPSWDRPQAACLSSRFPTFEPVTLQGLSQIDRSEAFLHSLGFKQVRVRHYGDRAKVEIDKDELPRLLDDPALLKQVIAKLQEFGYREVLIDPEGYRQGAANTFLQPADIGV